MFELPFHLSGFRSRYSTQHALSILLFKWQNCLEKSELVCTILMDLSKALVSILYDFITAKLHAYGVDYDSLSLTLSYLLNRQHRIKVDSVFRSRLETIIRVPQGSILGRLLFNMSLNGLFLISLRSIVCSLADDSTLYCCGETT